MNNRVIKFRAWDAERNTMSYPIEQLYISGDEGFAHLFQSFYDDNLTDDSDVFFENRKPCILMQFIGLYDSKGQEIYEGDILTDSKDRYVCEFRNGRSRTGFNFPCIRVNKSWDFGGAVDEYLTIIGNIFQNPELLEWKKCEFVEEYGRTCYNEVKRLAVGMPCCEEHAKIREQSIGIFK